MEFKEQMVIKGGSKKLVIQGGLISAWRNRELYSKNVFREVIRKLEKISGLIEVISENKAKFTFNPLRGENKKEDFGRVVIWIEKTEEGLYRLKTSEGIEETCELSELLEKVVEIIEEILENRILRLETEDVKNDLEEIIKSLKESKDEK